MKRFGPFIDRLEENFIAVLLATMTIVTFTQVVARYGFHSGWDGALEFTRVLFAWLILFGMSYGIKHGSHLGVDALIRLFPKPLFRTAAVFGALAGVLYASILLSSDWLNTLFDAPTRGGAIDYWMKMYKIGIGLDDLKYPMWMQDTFGLQDRIHRWIAYLMLPVGLGLFGFRCLQAVWAILTGKREAIIAAHEGEDLVAENKDVLAE